MEIEDDDMDINSQTQEEIKYLEEYINNYICTNEAHLKIFEREVCEKLMIISKNLEENKHQKAADMANIAEETYSAVNEDKISELAATVLSNSEGPLQPEIFKHLLLHEVRGKPNPPVLPLVRQHTQDVEGVLKQLREVMEKMRECIKEYHDQRRLDRNFTSRMERFKKNVTKELEKEAKEGRSQRSIHDYIIRE